MNHPEIEDVNLMKRYPENAENQDRILGYREI